MLTLEFPTGVKHTKNTLTKCTHERGTEKEKEEGEQMEGVMSLHKSVCVCVCSLHLHVRSCGSWGELGWGWTSIELNHALHPPHHSTVMNKT